MSLTPEQEQAVRREREANQFAMALLMPESMVRAEVKKIGPIDLLDDRKIKELAKRFQVSVQIMTLRLGEIFLL